MLILLSKRGLVFVFCLDIFLHRCFVLQNHLLNDVVWLTAESR